MRLSSYFGDSAEVFPDAVESAAYHDLFSAHDGMTQKTYCTKVLECPHILLVPHFDQTMSLSMPDAESAPHPLLLSSSGDPVLRFCRDG